MKTEDATFIRCRCEAVGRALDEAAHHLRALADHPEIDLEGAGDCTEAAEQMDRLVALVGGEFLERLLGSPDTAIGDRPDGVERAAPNTAAAHADAPEWDGIGEVA